MKISELISRLFAHHAPLDPARRTCDGVQFGDAEQECTGIVVTCCPTVEVIRKAAELGCNLVLGHEPLFFDGWDDTDWQKDGAIYAAKRQLLEETSIVVCRDHDHMHNDKPDGIFSGLIRRLGWESYACADGFFPGAAYELPPTTAGEIAEHLKDVMHITGLRLIGDPALPVTRVALVGHFLGGEWDKQSIRLIEKYDSQLIIPGEVIDWTIGQYVADSCALGKPKALLNVGHFNWEEPGMRELAEHLPEILNTGLPVHFVQSGDFWRWK